MKKKTLEEVMDDGKITQVMDKGECNDLGLIMNDPKKLKRYQEAIEGKRLLFDKEDKEGIDYTHMEFILSQPMGFHKDMNFYQMMKMFWKQFYPYLKNIADSYEALYERYRFNIDDTEEVLANYAETDLEIKIMKEFIKEKGLTQEMETRIHNIKQEIIKKNAGKEFKRASDMLPDLYDEGEGNV